MKKNLVLIFVAIFAIFSCKEKNNEIRVSEVTLNKSTLTLDEGASDTIIVTITPNNAKNKSVIWHTSDQLVATVSNEGIVSAFKKGTATITVTSVDGKRTANCRVTVEEVPISDVNVTGITLNQPTLSLVVRSTDSLVATITPDNATDKKVTWSTSNTTVAKISEGKVTALAAGEATITVKTRNGGKTATCKVTVTRSVIPLTGITLNRTTLELKRGKTEVLSVIVQPENATTPDVKWETHNEEIATVDNMGKVTAVSNGHAVIRVTTKDGQYSSDCSVTVVPVVTELKLNKTTLTLALKEKETLIATISPVDADNKKVNWFTSNSRIVSVNETGELTAVSIGTITITAQTDDGGKVATCEVTVVPPKIGDYYYSDDTYSTDLKSSKTPIGMIFLVNNNHSGKILALQEPLANWNTGLTDEDGYIAWSTFDGEAIGVTNPADGVENMTFLKNWIASNNNTGSYTINNFPAFKWCAEYATAGYSVGRWYLPAHTELRQLCAGISGLKWVSSGADANKGEINDWNAENISMPNYTTYDNARNTFNSRLTAARGKPITLTLTLPDDSAGYWSSTESGSSNAFFIDFNGGGTVDNTVSKPAVSFFVRAIATFPLP